MKTLLIILVSLFSCLSNASIHDYKKVTWNMQGSGGGNKWATSVLNTLLNNGNDAAPDVVAIQEGGAGPGYFDNLGVYRPISGVTQLPEPGTSLSPIPVTAEGFSAGYPEVMEFKWVITRRGQVVATYYVYGAISDLSSSGRPGRVNSFLISRHRADEVILIASRLQDAVPGTRPNFGIRLGTSYLFSNHSVSNASAASDSAHRMSQIEQFVSARGPQNDWVLMGDFNASPEDVTLQASNFPELSDIALAYTGDTTQTSGNELDYMVFRDVQGAGGGNVSATVFFAMLISMYNSDHFPVRFY